MRPDDQATAAPRRDEPALVLASRSPQRRAILEQLGIAFEVDAADVEELSHGDPVAVARDNALRKAQAAAARRPDATILGVDTLVALDGRIYGKPADADEARATLTALAGRTHEVVSGLALGDRTNHAITRVTMRTGLVDWYLPHEEWRGRAGGYAIQGRGAALVREIAGDYLNVVGLPVAALLDLAPEVLTGAR